MVKVSIIIPVYNGEKYLAATISSLLAQTMPDFEIVIVNDGSTDSTAAIIDSLINIDSRITKIDKQNSGVSDSRNCGLLKSAGKYVVFFDADDLAKPDFLSARMQFLDAHPDYGICGSTVDFVDEGDRHVNRPSCDAPGENLLEQILTFDASIAACPSNLMIRRQLVADYHIFFNTQLSSSSDKFFLFQLGKYTRCYSLPQSTFSYRLHVSSMSGSLTTRRFNDSKKYVSLVRFDRSIKPHIKIVFYNKAYYMLAGMAFKLGFYRQGLKYLGQYYFSRLNLTR